MSVLSVSPTPQVAVESYEVDSSDVCRFRINISVGARSWSGKRLLKSISKEFLLFSDILFIKPYFFLNQRWHCYIFQIAILGGFTLFSYYWNILQHY